MKDAIPDIRSDSEDARLEDFEAGSPEADRLPELTHILMRIQREILTLRTEHKAISKRIEVIKSTAAGLANVFGCEAVGGRLAGTLSGTAIRTGRLRKGLTGACRKLLEESAEPVTLRQMIDGMRCQEPDLIAHHKHPEATLRTVLRRLVSYGEAKEMARSNGGHAWQAIRPNLPRTDVEP